MASAGAREQRPYHHGNLRRVLLDAAAAEIAERGPSGLSLRELARRAGVSHAAPTHHFGDKRGLLTAVAAEGYERLGATLRRAQANGGFLEVGLAYLQFAIDQPAHFDVMFQPDLYDADDPAVVDARAASTRVLYGTAAGDFPDADARRVGIAGWAFVHGFASLWRSHSFGDRLGDDPIAAAGDVARVLFRPA
jgi:AcrR family transcriptional regulator